MKQKLKLSKVYALLEPGPVVLVSTAYHGREDIMTMSWHTMLEFDPPMVGCVISNQNFSFDLLKASKTCVINIPTVTLAKKVVGCGNCSGAEVDKFEQFELTRMAAELVDAPLIDECFANLECRVVDSSLVSKYSFFILEVVKAWIDPTASYPKTMHHQGFGQFMIAGKRIQLKSNMR